jgi:hypothetical protein
MDEKKSQGFAVVFYTDYRKENEWQIHRVFHESKTALDFAAKWSVTNKKNLPDYVAPSEASEILWDEPCKENPLKNDDEGTPWEGLSWSPRIAVVKVKIE